MEYALLVRWLVLYALLFAAGLPIASRLFPRLDGRGAGFALPVALVVLALPVYWLGHVHFGTATIVVGVVVLVVAAILASVDLAGLRNGEVTLAGLRNGEVALASDLEIDRRAVGEVGVVFVGAFLLVVAIRAVDPAVYPLGGEKFLDFGLLKTLERATVLPPEDMWFASEPLQYYYGGHLIASVLGTLTMTPPRFAYNLALAGFYATLVAAAYDLAAAVGVARDLPRRTAGAFGAFFVGFAANLVTAWEFAGSLLPATIREPLDLDGEFEFFYWDASRVIEGTINEFPLFAWLNGDLHAHMMGMPFLALGAGLSYAYYLTPETDRRRRQMLAFVAVPVLAGLVVVVDTWSVPSLFGLLGLAMLFGSADPWTLLPERLVPRDAGQSALVCELRRLFGTGVVTAIAGLLGAILAAPFFLGAASGRDVALLEADARSSLEELLLVHGAFLLIFLVYLFARLRPFDRQTDRGIGPVQVLVLVGVLVATSAVALTQNLAVGVIAGPLLVLGWVLLRTTSDVGFETVLVVAGAGLVAIVEVVYVVEQAGPVRLNTVFKTYMQVWVLWGIGAGVVATALLDAPRTGDRTTSMQGTASSQSGADSLTTSIAGNATTILIVVVVLSTGLYGAFALSEHFESGAAHGETTLDATAFVAQDHPDRAEAIAYVDDLEGQPTMLSAPATSRCPGGGGGCAPGMYSFDSSPAASLTGVPTVAGWAHQIGYRGEEPYLDRMHDVDQFYTGTPEERAAIVRAYDVEYVWVGPAEHERYDDVTVEQEGLDVAHASGSVTIYAVDHDELPE